MEAGKEMKKKALLIVAACACFITGCGAEKSTENKMKITESLHSASGESVSCLASVFTTQDGLLHIFDPNQKSSIVLCNKSNCEHEPYDENTNPDPTCDAALNKDLFFNCVPVISGEYVYLFGQADLSKGVVYREKLDGSGRTKLYNLDYQVNVYNSVYVENGIAYAEAEIPIVKEDNIGGAGSNSNYSVLLAINLESGETKEISDINKEKFHGLLLLEKSGEKLYYESTYRKLGKKDKDYSTAKEYSKVYEYNIKTGKQSQVCSEKDLEGCIVIGMIDQAVYVYNQETMEVFEVAIGSKKKKKIYKPDKTDVLYYTYKNHLIRGDMEKEKFYYLKDSAWEELEASASFTNTFGDFAEYYDKKNVIHVVYGDSLFKDQKKELFERK